MQPGNASFNLFEQFVIGGNLSIQIAFSGNYAALFHLLRGNAQMHRWDFLNALSLITAMVDSFQLSGSFQRLIGIIRPCAAPDLSLFFVVPVRRIFPMIFPSAPAIRDALTAFIQFIDLAAFCAPFPVLFQRTNSQQNMGMRISCVAVMDGKIGAHAFVYKIIFHIRTDKG